MTRPGDWSPIWSGDPTPGDPDGVSGAADTYGRTAENIGVAASALLSISDDVWMCSDAVDAFQARASEVRSDILRVQSRYAAASSVLSGYAGQLREAQAESLRILAAAQQTQNDRDLAQYRMQHANDEVACATDPLAKSQAQFTVHQQQRIANQADGDIDAYRSQLADVVTNRQAAARVAMQGLDDADTTSALRGDTFIDQLEHEVDELVAAVNEVIAAVKETMDGVAQWIVDNADLISKILDVFSTICGVIGFCLLFVPGAEPFGAALLAIAKGLQIASLVVKALKVEALVYQVARNKAPAADLGPACLDLGISALLFFVPAAAGTAISKQGLKLLTGRATARLAAGGALKSARNQVDKELGVSIRKVFATVRKEPVSVQQWLVKSIEKSKIDLELESILFKGSARQGYTFGTRLGAGAAVVLEHSISDVLPKFAEKPFTTFMRREIDHFDDSVDELFLRRISCPLPVRIVAGAVA